MISADWLLGFTDERTGTAAPVADTALTEKIKELERLLDMLKAENQGLKYALDAFKR
jgi:hypothetical protein